MKVLVACERSGIVRDAFLDAGHDAWSCDLEPTDTPGNHIINDALVAVYCHGPWDMMIAHPPCTFLTNAANRWLYEDSSKSTVAERLMDRMKAMGFFLALKNAPVDRIAIENPWPNVEVIDAVGPPNDYVQPYMFGDPESKGVYWWLKNLPPLMSTQIESSREQKKWRLSPGPERDKLRSEFFPGMAAAMAEQWGTV